MGDTNPKAAATAAINSSAFMENLRQLFGECDRDQSGSLGPDEFKELCSKIGLSAEMADETFKRLDIDRNSQITFDEFAAGFNQYKQQAASAGKSNSAAAAATSSPAAQQQHAPIGTRRSTNSPPPRFKNHLQQQQQQQQQQQLQTQQLSPSPVSTRARSRASPIRPASGGSGTAAATALSFNSTQSRSSSSTNLTGRSTSTSSGAARFDSSVTRSTSSADGFASSCDGGGGGGSVAPLTGTNRANNDVIVYSSDMIGGASNGDYGAGELAGNSGQFGSLLSSTGSYNQMKTMQDLLECVQKLQSENQILTQIFFKDKREREEYISQLGEEFDQQLREVEERANRRAKEELETEKKRLSEMMQTERETLQHHYQTLEKLNKMVKSGGASGTGGASGSDADMAGGITKVKSQLEDTFVENRQLKKSLMDTKTDVAMIWKEMEKLKKQYESKLSSAYEKQRETQHECDHIKLQLNLMKDSNRKLQDASDVITNYIADKVEPVIKVAMDGAAGGGGDDESHSSLGAGGLRLNAASSASNSRRGSILSEYLNNEQDDDCDLESMASSNGGGGSNRLKSSASTSKLMHKRMNGGGGGGGLESQRNERFNQSTTSSSSNQTNDHNLYLHVPSGAKSATAKTNQQNLKNSKSASGKPGDDQSSRGADRRQDGDHQATNKQQHQVKSPEENLGAKTNKSSNPANEQQQGSSRTSLKSIGRHFLLGGRTQSEPKPQDEDAAAAGAAKSADHLKSASADQADEPIVEPADGPSVATFNIILVGDSFVGKSSFAARFIEGNFVQGLISNCSIDFKTKTYKVDGTNYTVNLWDTAGQERFRSITASYFRKADGIILMYDVTEKRSYLNVRNWMSTISDTAAENVAVLLVGNKIDLRINDNKANCVPTEEGFRLAKEYDIVFLETSVKTGANLLPSMGKLLRLIAKNNTLKDEDNDRIRLSDKGRTFNCMPKNC